MKKIGSLLFYIMAFIFTIIFDQLIINKSHDEKWFLATFPVLIVLAVCFTMTIYEKPFPNEVKHE